MLAVAAAGFIVAVVFAIAAQRLERTVDTRRYAWPSIWVASTGASVTIGMVLFLLIGQITR